MRFQPTQLVLSAAAIGVAGIVFSQSYTEAVASDKATFVATPEQRLTARQVAALLDRAHYSNKRFDSEMGLKVLEMYFDRLDPNHTLFLKSDVDELTKKYGSTFADRLKKGDLSAAQSIFNRYIQRSNEYYNFANKFFR